ncbi:MAG: M4 family metallopeptidase [Acidobacteriota bacterium]
MGLVARSSRLVVGLLLLCLALPARPAAQSGGLRTVSVSSPNELRDWDTQVTRMVRDGDLRVRSVEVDARIEGRSHERLDQYYKGVRIFGGQMVRQLDQGQTVSVFGALYAGMNLDTEPALNTADAVGIVDQLTGVTLGRARQPELMVVPRDEGGYVLAYRARVMTGTDIIVYFIDARTGAIALQYSDLETAVGTGKGVHDDTKKLSTTERSGGFRALDSMRPASIYTYDMKGNLNRVISYLNGQILLGDADIGSDADNTWTDPATVDAHAYGGWTYDYFYKRFNRQGLNGKNMTESAVVHPVRREDAGTASTSVFNLFYLNAFYAGDGIMVYGEGLPTTMTAGGYRWNYFSGALDVVAHELTHGVTDYTSGLIYRNESGALNEAFSDIMGTSVEFYFQQVGTGYMKADYLMGEDLTNPMAGFRSMANPAAYADPDHYSRRYTGTSDNGGVHSNSGIANHAFYLAIEGGTNRTSGLSVQGVGSANRERIEQIFYRAFTQLLPASATFSVARAATIQAARDLYGANSDAERAVTQAWTAVGVN